MQLGRDVSGTRLFLALSLRLFLARFPPCTYPSLSSIFTPPLTLLVLSLCRVLSPAAVSATILAQ